MTLLLFTIPFPVLFLVRYRLRPIFQSPAWVAVLTIWLIGLLGYLMSAALSGAQGATVSGDIGPDLAARTGRLFAATAICLSLGVALAAWLRPAPVEADGIVTGPVEISPTIQGWILPVSTVPFLIVVFGGGNPMGLLERTDYLSGAAGGSVSGIAAHVGIGAVAACGYVFARGKGSKRVLAVGLAVAYYLLFFALATRRINVLPLCFALGAYVAVMNRRSKVGMLVAAAMGAATLPVPLYMRGIEHQGLIPYLKALPGLLSSDVSWTDTLNNVLVAFPITALSAFESSPIPLRNLLIELNPAPGNLAGWYQINGSMRLNRYTPFSGVGEVGNLGWFTVAVVWILVGVLLAWMDARCWRLVNDGARIAAACIVGLAGLFAISVVEYNLRNSQRDLIYAVIFIFTLQAWKARSSRQSRASLLAVSTSAPAPSANASTAIAQP